MKSIKYLLLVLMVIFFSGCCFTNYSTDIDKITTPLQKDLVSFYKDYQRYPSEKERNELLERVGCHMQNNICIFLGNSFLIRSYEHDTGTTRGIEYVIKLNLENTYCSLRINKHNVEKNCSQANCLNLKQ